MNQVIVSGVASKVQKRSSGEVDLTDVTLVGKTGSGAFSRVRVRVIGKGGKYIEEGKAILLIGNLANRQVGEYSEASVVGAIVIPIEGGIASNEHGPYLEGAQNEVSLAGYLGKDAKTEAVQVGDEAFFVNNLRLAVRDRKNETVWVNARAWGEELCEQLNNAAKGDQVVLRGYFRVRRSERDGEVRYYPEVIVKEILAVSRKPLVEDNDFPF